MGLGGILILLLLLVSLIVFIYIIVMTAKGWGVLHTILLCILFIECWVFMVFAAGVQDRRVRYTKEAHLAQVKAEAALKETTRLLYGTFDAGEDVRDAVVPVRGMVRRLAAARGRVWRQLLLLQSDNNQFMLELSAGRPAAAAGDGLEDVEPAAAPTTPAATVDSLPAELVVYAFSESVGEDGLPRPEFYLGEYKILQSQAGQVTLAPTLPLQSFQQEYIASGSAASWMLYELMPVDSHEAFAAEGSKPTPEEIFGRMDPDAIAKLFADVPTENGLQQQIIDAYVRDGQRATANEEQAAVWVQVNMLRGHSVDVDSQEVANATVGSYYDSIGRSVDTRLKRDDSPSVELTPEMNSELIVLKAEVAQELIDAGKAELVQRIYVRPLNDYEEAFNRNIVRAEELKERITLVQRETTEIGKANELGNEMITFRQVENQKLTNDLQGIQQENAVLSSSLTEANKQLDSLKKELSRMYRSIQARRNQLPL
jgi:hypothetical protein